MKRCLGCMELYENEYQICPHCGYEEGKGVDKGFHMMPGEILADRYLIGKVIGYGGFGVTYIAWDKTLDKKVAIKEYLPSEFSTRVTGHKEITVYADEKQEQFNIGVEKFIDEAKRLMKLKDVDGVVRIFNCFKENGTAYIVMEYLDGETVDAMLARKGKFPVDVSLNIIMPIMKAMEEVHNYGIIHRDISPDNIMITKDYKVKLIDFGASRYATAKHSKNMSILVKEGFAPKEQYSSSGQGTWTDVYSLAATFYAMVTGSKPQNAMDRNMDDKLLSLRKSGIDIPKHIDNAIMNALNINPGDRTQNFTELRRQIVDETTKRNYIKQRKLDIGRWPLWAKIVSGAAGGIIILLLILMGCGVIKFDFVESFKSILSGNQVEVPEVIARDMESAEKKIGDAGLVPQYVDYIEDDSIPGDCVYSQSPGANERISKGDTVFLVLSCGVEKKTMPNLVGYKKERAISRLEAMGVTVQETEVESNGNPGSVVRQLCSGEVIEEGAEISEGMVVTLEISTGRPDIYDASGTMPDFTGKTYEEALEMARESHIYIYITQDSPDEKYDRGLIIGQQYPMGQGMDSGTVVKLHRSVGSKVIVPEFRLKAVDEIEDIASHANVKYELQYEDNDTVAKDHVISQSVESGTEIQYSDVVILKVSNGNSKAEEYNDDAAAKMSTEKSKKTSSSKKNSDEVVKNADNNVQQPQENAQNNAVTETSKQTQPANSQNSNNDSSETSIPYIETDSWIEDGSMKDSPYYTCDEKTQYLVQTRDKKQETTTSGASSMSGWTMYDSTSTWSEYGAWSGWQDNPVSSSSSREVRTQSVQTSAAYTKYNWYYYRYWNTYHNAYYYTYSPNMGGTRYTWQTDYVLPEIGVYDGIKGYKPQGGKNFSAEIWFLESTENVPATSKTQYSYRDRSMNTTYYFKRDVYGEWSGGEWKDDKPDTSDVYQIADERTLYYYKRR